MHEAARYPARYALFLIAYYVTNSVFQGYMSLYYTAKGFSAGQIGVIYSVVALVSLASQPLWGILADRQPSKNRVLRLLTLAACGVMLCYLLINGFWPILLLAGCFSVFYTSIQPMGDSIILESLGRMRRPFGPIRLAACWCFAIANVIFGRLITAGNETMVVYSVAIMCVVTFASTYSLPETPGMQSVKGHKMSFSTLFTMKPLMLVLAFSVPLQITLGYFFTFFSPHFISLPGASSALLGWCYFLSAVSETPFLLLSDRLFNRFGAGKLICVSALALTLRWLIVATSDAVWAVMASQLLHSVCFIVITVTVSLYINRIVPPELKASGQMLLAIVTFGVARVVGNLGGGLLADLIGRQNVFYVSAGLCLASLLCFGPHFLRSKPLNGLDQ